MATTSQAAPQVQAYATVGERRLVRVYVWEVPVRITHWVMVSAIAVLTVTGWYIHSPYLISRSPSAYTMGYMRFAHILTGYILLATIIFRAYWAIAGNYWANWKGFVPTNRKQWKSLGQMIRYYTFFRREPVHGVGHNPLAGITYVGIFCLLGLETVTGLVLYAQTRGPGIAHALFSWVPLLIDLQYLRLIHYLIMWVFIGFVIHHVYSAILVSIEERNGVMESIFSGYKFVPEADLKAEEQYRLMIYKKSLPARIARRLVQRGKKEK